MPVIAPQIERPIDDRPSELAQIPPHTAPRYSWRQLLLSRYHGCWYAIAATWCEQVGLTRYGSCEIPATLRSRLPAVASCWRRSHA